MATVGKSAPATEFGKRPKVDREQLRRDRIVAVVIILVAAAIMGALLWLGSIGALPEGGMYEPPLMP